MHPFHTITLAHEHIAEMQSRAARNRLARRARQDGRARSPAPLLAAAETIALPFLSTPDERRPAA